MMMMMMMMNTNAMPALEGKVIFLGPFPPVFANLLSVFANLGHRGNFPFSSAIDGDR